MVCSLVSEEFVLVSVLIKTNSVFFDCMYILRLAVRHTVRKFLKCVTSFPLDADTSLNGGNSFIYLVNCREVFTI